MTEHRHAVLGTAGHIDHGKTALVRALTGIDTDRLPAEKRRGITIDLGFAVLDLGSARLAIVDVPGHERFVRNMLAGATGLDLALLVVAADDAVMPQTREHLEILRLLGIPAGVVALTKCDLAEPDWLDLVEADVRTLVAGTFLEQAPIVRTSAVTGEGLDDLKHALARLVETAPRRDDPGPFRLAIDRVFSAPGHGTVVTGTIASGTVALGDELELWPAARPVRVRGLQQHQTPVERLGRGARAALNLGGVRKEELQRGHVLASPGYLRTSQLLSVQIQPVPGAASPLRHRGRYRLYLGTTETAAVLALLEDLSDRPALAQLRVAEPIVAVHGQPFILRAESPPTTLGGGTVIQPTARRLRRRDTAARERLRSLGAPDPATRARAALAAFGLTPASELDLVREAGLTRAEVPSVLAACDLIELPLGPRRSVRLPAELVAELELRLLRALDRLHAAHPRQTAIRRTHLAAALPDLGADAPIAALLDRLQQRGLVVGDAQAVARADHHPRLTQAEQTLAAQLASAVADGGFSPPDLTELTRRAGPRAASVPELLTLLADEGAVVEIGPGLYLSSRTEDELRRRVADRLTGDATITMAELRDLLGTTRRFAVPIGEYLDRIGLTRREGDLRRLARRDPDPLPG